MRTNFVMFLILSFIILGSGFIFPSVYAPYHSEPVHETIDEPISKIPAWVKNNAGWWAERLIEDSEFLQGIQYLIKQGIMVIPPTEKSAETSDQTVPSWVRNNAGWWAEGQIDDNTFLSGIQYLVKVGTIVVEQQEVQPSKTPPAIMITKGEKHLVPLDQIRGGGVPKDGIPSIDDPKFAIATEAESVPDDELIIGLNLNGEKKAYPFFIMVWHEIVNDKFGDTSVAVTYCPLCFTTQVFDRTVNGQEVEFGVSGKLYNSNLVMYDRLTDSYWSQSLGIAIKGELTGTELERIPFDVMRWKDWKQLYPDTLVLTTETGTLRAYGSDPYGSYYTDPRIIFPVSNKDPRLDLKEVIIGVEQDGFFKAYKQKDIESANIINDVVGEKELMLISLFKDNSRAFYRQIDGNLLEFSYTEGKIVDEMTGSEWNYEGVATSGPLKDTQLGRVPFDPSFWFEWVAMHPETEVYQK